MMAKILRTNAVHVPQPLIPCPVSGTLDCLDTRVCCHTAQYLLVFNKRDTQRCVLRCQNGVYHAQLSEIGHLEPSGHHAKRQSALLYVRRNSCGVVMLVRSTAKRAPEDKPRLCGKSKLDAKPLASKRVP